MIGVEPVVDKEETGPLMSRTVFKADFLASQKH